MTEEIKKLIVEQAENYSERIKKNTSFKSNERIAAAAGFTRGAIIISEIILSKWQEAERWRKVEEELPECRDNRKKMKVYISGPITGLPYKEVEKAFSKAEKRLKEEGYEVVSPLKNGLPRESTWNEHMRADIKLLLDCDAIYLLKGYQDSKGAMIEYDLARILHFETIEQLK